MQCIRNDSRCVWERTPPSTTNFIIYGFLVPTLASFGLCANFLNAVVFMRPKMTPSAFSYLAALSWMESLSCLLITMTAFSRSILFNSTFWLAYDFCWQTPLFGTTTGASNLILACVSVDRLIYLWSGTNRAAPRFCRNIVARCMICVVILFSALLNLPYFFVFVVNKDGTFMATNFFHSGYYRIHNWLTFIVLTVVPAICLLIGNVAIIFAFRRWAKQRRVCQKFVQSKNAQKIYQHQTKLTVMIVIVIMLYMIGELPAHLTSRKSALNLIFNGDPSKVNLKFMEHLETICISLNALQLSMNIVIYAVINPSFMSEFFQCLRSCSDACFRIFGINMITNFWKSHMTSETNRDKQSCQTSCASAKTAEDIEFKEQSFQKCCEFNHHSLRYPNRSYINIQECLANGVNLRRKRLDLNFNELDFTLTKDNTRSGGDKISVSKLAWKRSHSVDHFLYNNVVKPTKTRRRSF